MRMGSFSTLIAVVALAVTPSDVAIARADYAASVAQGQEPRYLALHSTDPSLIAATMFMVPASSTGKVLDGMVPQRMPGTNLLRIDLRELQWDVHSWMAVAGYPNNPMVAHENPLIVDASWLLNELADGTQSAAYFKLMFGKKQPKTLDEFLAAFGIDRKQQDGLQYGVIPNASGVNLARNASRLMEHSDGVYSEAWITWDVKDVKDGADPLQGLFANGFKADGSEGYVLTTRLAGTERVILPVTFLADAKGKLVHEAPADLVEDTTELFGDRIIRSPGSCFVCHTEGSQPVDGNALADRLRAGVELKAYEYAKQKQIEFFHLANTAPELKRWDDGFARALVHINGLTPAENSAAIKQAIGDYLKDVTLERAASELACEPERLRLALAWASARYIDVGPRLAGLAHDVPVPRSQWKNDYLKAKRYVEDFKP
jgi:hypothetical protein